MKTKLTKKFSSLFVKEDGGEVAVSNSSSDSASSGLRGSMKVNKRKFQGTELEKSLNKDLQDTFK